MKGMKQREKEIVVIIGAGRSGRGYLARQINAKTQKIVFVDKNAELIERLNAKKTFEIRFFGGMRQSVPIQDYEAYDLYDPSGEGRICQAAYIFICVGEENLGSTARYLTEVLKRNGTHRPLPPKVVIAAENGTKNLKILKSNMSAPEIMLSECLMLCTTEEDCDCLNIWSEDMDYLPYNTEACPASLPFAHFEPCGAYPVLVHRKIYTYNSLSACIAYLGAYKGYRDYGKAANDSEIYELTEQLERTLNQAICIKYNISETEQAEFSARAKQKFRNTEILDTISRNTRNAERKLSSGERIAEPIKMMIQYDIDTTIMELTAAAAFLYGISSENLDPSWLMDDRKLESLFGLEDQKHKENFKKSAENIRTKYVMLQQGELSSTYQ